MAKNPSILFIFTGANHRSVNVKKWLDLFKDGSELNIAIMLPQISSEEMKSLEKQYPDFVFIYFKSFKEMKNLSLLARYKYIQKISKGIDLLKVDVIHLHGAFYNYMIYPLYWLRSNPVLIYNIWGSDFNLKYRKKLKNTLILKSLIMKADLIWTNWFQLGFTIKSLFPEYKEKIKSIPWGVPEYLFYPPDPNLVKATKDRFGLSQEDYVLLYTRGLVPNSNHQKLLDAVALLPRSLKFKLIIHHTRPDSENAKNLKQFVQSHKLTGKVLFSEQYMDELQMQALYHVADLVFSLTTQEQFSQVIVEAILARCQLILHQNEAYQFLKEVFRFHVELVDVFNAQQLAQKIEYFIRNRPKPDYSYESMVIDRLFRFSRNKSEIIDLYRELIYKKTGK